MSKKKIIVIAFVVAVIVASAVSAVFFLNKDDVDELTTPIPASIEIESSADFPVLLADVTVKKEALTKTDEAKTANLYSVSYQLVSYASEKTYITSAGLTSPEQKINEYYDADSNELVYTVVIDRELSATYDGKGTIVRLSSDYSPETDYDTENVTWFYKDGKVACGELSFYDVTGNFGTAYYNGDGSLACVVTELYPVEDGEASVVNTYYNSSFETVTREAFMSLVPTTDADSFLYVNW